MPFDALVLLGCRMSTPLVPGAALRRVERAARAFADGLAPFVVVSGGRRWNGAREADVLGAALVERGVPREALLLERTSRTTHENATASAALLLPQGRCSIAVVSCDWHVPRALYCFRRAGFEATGFGAPSPPLPPVRRLLRALREQSAWLHVLAVARS